MGSKLVKDKYLRKRKLNKMKKFYIIGLMALLTAACSTDDDVINGSTSDIGSENTDGSERYLAIQILAPNDAAQTTESGEGSRSGGYVEGNTYANGEDRESSIDVSKLYFYFYDDNGNAVSVTTEGYNYTTALSTNTSSGIGTTEQTNGGSVSHLVNAIVLLRNVSTLPTQVVTVLNTKNPVTAYRGSSTISGMAAATINYGYTSTDANAQPTNFVMSDAAYVDLDANGIKQVVRATAISPANLCSTKAEALKNPVEIYVERTMCKAEVLPTESNLYDVKTTLADGTTPVYVKIKSWCLFDKVGGSYLMKQLPLDSYGDAVNRTADHRSFWMDYTDYTKFNFNTTTLAYSDITHDVGEGNYDYTLENRPSATEGYATKVIVAAQVVDADGNPMPVGKFQGQLYKLDDLKQLLAQRISADKNYTNLNAEDINFIKYEAGDYHARISLATNKTYTYTRSNGKESTKNAKSATGDALTWISDHSSELQIWNDGNCYYYDYIRHQVADSKLSANNDDRMMVRNNWYRLNVAAIEGLGTPVPDTTDPVNPTRPEDDEWTMNLIIRIYSWRIVPMQLDFDSVKTDQDFEEELYSDDD
jgi:hypothetical protein